LLDVFVPGTSVAYMPLSKWETLWKLISLKKGETVRGGPSPFEVCFFLKKMGPKVMLRCMNSWCELRAFVLMLVISPSFYSVLLRDGRKAPPLCCTRP